MDTLPKPYDQYLVLDGGEQPLNCWWGVPVRVDQWGNPVHVYRDALGFQHISRHPINTKAGIVVLTNQRLQSYVRCGPMDAYGIGRDARLYLALPFRSMQSLAASKGITQRVLQVNVNGEVHYGGQDGSLSGRTESGRLHFSLEYGVNLTQMVDDIQAAATQAGGGPGLSDTVGESSAGPLPSAPADPQGGGDSFIHFHAEEE